MAQRRAITSHPAFAPLIALWFAALLGLTVAVLPAPVMERGLAATGLGQLVPLSLAGRVGASILAAAVGALGGYGLARFMARRAPGDPRPLYADEETGPATDMACEPPIRRPLRVREELAGGFGDESEVMPGSGQAEPIASAAPPEDGFMILTPQPIHPPQPAPDLDSLLDQFDSAFAAFRAGDGARTATAGASGADSVHAFVAQQTGVPTPSRSPSPLGGLVPDHQAELRAALDKLARSHRKD